MELFGTCIVRVLREKDLSAVYCSRFSGTSCCQIVMSLPSCLCGFSIFRLKCLLRNLSEMSLVGLLRQIRSWLMCWSCGFDCGIMV